MTDIESRAQELIELPELADSPLPARRVAQAFILQALRTVEAETFERAARLLETRMKHYAIHETYTSHSERVQECAAAIRELTKGTP